MEAFRPEYRVAAAKDIDEIMSLWDESRQYHEQLDSRLAMVDNAQIEARDYYRKQLTSEEALFYIASKNDVSIGYICAQIHNAPPVHKVQRFGFIDGLFVKSDYRKMSVGTGLFNLAKEWFKEREISMIQLAVASRNRVGMLFWEQFGFTEIMRRMRLQV